MSKRKRKPQQPLEQRQTPQAGETEPARDAGEGNAPAPEAQENAEFRRKLHRRHVRALRDLLIRVAALALVLYVLFFHLVGVLIMPSADMYPRIDAGDLVLFYRLEHKVHAQDVIVFRKPTASLEQSYAQETAVETVRTEKNFFRKALDWLGFPDPADPPMTTFVCRVAAGPGDTVEISEGERLIVNGNTMIETNIFYSTPEYAGFVEYPLTLGEGQYFVLADARNGGADSRFFGAVDEEDILGPVITIMRRNNL